MKIGELANRLGIAASKIRYLESEGLIKPARQVSSGYRDYDESAVVKLRIVLQAQSFGFTLDEVRRAYADTADKGLRCDFLIDRLTRKLNEMDHHIEQACARRQQLLDTIKQLAARQKANSRLSKPNHGMLRLKNTVGPVRKIGKRISD